jgi:hypothetical protein
MKRIHYLGASGIALLLAAGVGTTWFEGRASAQGRGGAAPAYQVNPLWPLPTPDQSWVVGSVSGVTVDGQNRIWVVHRGNDSLQSNEKGMVTGTSSLCCKPAPGVLQYDANGKLMASFGAYGQGYPWPQATGKIAVDAKGNVWVAAMGYEPAPPPAAGGRGARGRGGDAPAAGGRGGDAAAGARGARGGDAAAGRGGRGDAGAARGGAAAGGARGAAPAGRGAAPAAAPPPPPVAPQPPAPTEADAHVLKFSPDGKHLLTIGTPGKPGDASSQTGLNRPSAVAYDAAANEIFVGDMGNRRIVVFDADKGTYKRHWFGTGETAQGPDPGPYKPGAPAKSFRDISCIEISRDGNVYVCDKGSNRIQVFDKSGKFIREAMVAPNTMGATYISSGAGVGPGFAFNPSGSVWDLAFSSDQQQQFVFVADGHNKKIRILRRNDLTEVGSFGSGGRYPGTFLAVAAVATDAQGNVYTGEMHHGKRVQKFVPAK